MSNYVPPFWKTLTVATAAANVNSTSFHLGEPDCGLLLVNVLSPSDLKSVGSIKVQVSHDDVTYFDIGFPATTFALTVNNVTPISDIIQQGMLGFDYFRLVTDVNPSANISISIQLTAASDDNPVVSGPLPAGTNSIGNIATNITTIKTSVTRPNDATPYSVGDCFSNSTSAPTAGGGTFTAAARTSGGTGKITDAVISMSAKSAFQGEIWVFDQAATNTNDNAAITLSAADVLNLVGVIPFNVNDTGSVAGMSYVQGLDIRFTCVGTANLRFLVVVKAAFTPANNEVMGITLKVEN